jgi:putative oxidoreductase
MTTTHQEPARVMRDGGVIKKTASPIQQSVDFAPVAVAKIVSSVRRWLARRSIILLRVSMGAIIFGYGLLKYFPGVSPAENLVQSTMHLLTFGLVPDKVALVLVATLECVIGLSLIAGRGLRMTIYPLVLWAIGVLSPVVLLPQRLFSGPDHAPTLEAQYVLKDIVFFAAILVIATTLRHRNKGAERQSTRNEDR